MRIRDLLLLASGLLLAARGSATVYYIAPNGNDANNGTSQSTPWKTIDKVNQVTFQMQPGDQFLFQRGGEWRGRIILGSSGTAASPIVLGAYGTGAAPIINGSRIITGWTVHSGNIYKAYVGEMVEQVYVNDARIELARWPNTGYARNTQASGTTLQSNSITQASGFFTGARAVVRVTASSVDTLRITGHSGTTLTFGSTPSNSNMGNQDWGFYIENKLNLLDAPGEWFYESSSGQLYLWAPGGVNPSTLTVEASTFWAGVECYWQRQYLTIQDLHFRKSRNAGVRQDGANYVTVNNCILERSFHGIRSYGTYDVYTNNIIRRTYATGALIIDNNTLFANNQVTNVATRIGLGEHSWGYFGVRSIGSGNIIRANRLDSVGYTAIEANSNALVEKNVITRYNFCLNDGGGINFDNSNGIIIQDNLIRDAIGGLDASPTNVSGPNLHVAMGIYFGNTSNVSATVQRNTIMNLPGTGINVDHNMNSTNYQVKDNVVFNCDVGLSISDYSNSFGPNAVYPYYVASYNGVYSGNQVYCTNKDQMAVRWYNCHSTAPVDFGSYSNNRYYNPYNEMCLYTFNLFTGYGSYQTLERFQTTGEDAGSSRSPLRRSEFATASEITGNLVVNGDFATNVNGWGGWPTNAQVSRVTNFLDNGALRAYLPNAQSAPDFSMRNPDWFSVLNGEWYRVRVSLQAPANGHLRCGLKAQTALSNPYSIYERLLPFGPERRDLEFYFQNNITDLASMLLINNINEPEYYLDNVDVRRVTVTPQNPLDVATILYNETATAASRTLPTGCWSDLNGQVYTGSITIQPYSSKIFYKVADTQCAAQNGGTVSVSAFLAGPMDWTTNLMNDNLRSAGLIPTTEPYTALGYTLENSGATVSSAALAVTGNNAIVDWVVVELRNNDANYSVAARRACLVRRNGTVVTPDGNTVITFNTVTPAGRYLVVQHRNHLGAMTGSPLTASGQSVDLTQTTTGLYGSQAMRSNGTRRALWSGNVSTDGMLKYVGSGNDRDPILTAIGSTVPTAVLNGYRREDVNMDGVVKYVGTNNDRDLILSNVGGTVPTSTLLQQLP